MPYFDYDGDINLDVDDFLSACNSGDIKELIEALVDEGHLPKAVLHNFSTSPMGVSEIEFEESLDRLRGKWNLLTKEEEELIVKISKRF